jgi:hypothetical protein
LKENRSRGESRYSRSLFGERHELKPEQREGGNRKDLVKKSAGRENNKIFDALEEQQGPWNQIEMNSRTSSKRRGAKGQGGSHRFILRTMEATGGLNQESHMIWFIFLGQFIWTERWRMAGSIKGGHSNTREEFAAPRRERGFGGRHNRRLGCAFKVELTRP